MTKISRRTAFKSLLGAAAAVTAAGCAQLYERPAPPPPRPAPEPAGAELRRAFTESDWAIYRDCINKTMRAPVGRVWRWRNAQSGNGGSMAPTSPPQMAEGRSCRSFSETIALRDGRTERVSGRACQKADGTWDIVA